MPQLIAIGIALYLYFLLIQFLFVSIGPWFIYISSSLFSIAVPVTYLRALYGVFHHETGEFKDVRNWLFAIVLCLIALIHIDLLWISLYIGLPILYLDVARDALEMLEKVVFDLVGNRELVTFIWESLPSELKNVYLLVLASSAVKSAFIVPCVLAVRGLRSDIEGSQQPALLTYFHAQALKDLGSMVQRMVEELVGLILLANNLIVNITAFGAIFVWPLTIMAYIALLPPIAIAVVGAALFIAMHALALGAIWLLAMWASAVLALAERAVILSRAGYAKCPHAECHEPVPLPVFRCPACDAKHDRLIPGRFGLLRRTCHCGKGILPTLFWLGKGRLKSSCPKCGRSMREELFGGSLHLPIYGGPSVGKTMFMMAGTWELLEGKVPGVRATLIDETSDSSYSRHWKPDFESGRVREKTATPFPDAFLLAMRRGNGLPLSVYLYDPAGEALLDQDALEAHRFVTYIDGLALLIDPLSLPSLAELYQVSGSPAGETGMLVKKSLPATTSRENPEETLERVINLLERFGKLSRRRASKQRVAIIFTKTDEPVVADAFGIELDKGKAVHDRWHGLGSRDSRRIRKWLSENEPHLLQVLERRFKEIRFFAISSLGHNPSRGRGFEPCRVMEPLAWLLSRKLAFSRPLLGRLIGRTFEVGAVTVVVAAFVVLPIGGLIWLSLWA